MLKDIRLKSLKDKIEGQSEKVDVIVTKPEKIKKVKVSKKNKNEK